MADKRMLYGLRVALVKRPRLFSDTGPCAAAARRSACKKGKGKWVSHEAWIWRWPANRQQSRELPHTPAFGGI